MAPVMVCLISVESIRGCAGGLLLAEVSAEAGPVVAAEVDSGLGGSLKLAFDSLGVNCRKEEYYAKR